MLATGIEHGRAMWHWYHECAFIMLMKPDRDSPIRSRRQGKDTVVAVQGVDGGRPGGESRLDAVGWGVFFVVVGAVLLVPGLPDSAWIVAAGAVMIGSTLVRAWRGLDVPWTTALAGTAALVGGGAGILGLEREGWPLMLVAVGLVVIGLGFRRAHAGATLASSARAGR
jgi:hypothetical protein